MQTDVIATLVAQKLLEIKAVKLQVNVPFTWASGWKSPIYCDNRKTLSYPKVRDIIKMALAHKIMTKYENVECIAGVATGAIAIGALVADVLNIPFIYVRSDPKDHGLENLIEGELKLGSRVVVIEDLISTGGSSIKAVEAIRQAGGGVMGLEAIFSYNFPTAIEKFATAKCKFDSLSNYPILLQTAVKEEYIAEEDLPALQEWRADPANWRNDLK